MNIPEQIDNTSISRAPNAAHYEYLATVQDRFPLSGGIPHQRKVNFPPSDTLCNIAQSKRRESSLALQSHSNVNEANDASRNSEKTAHHRRPAGNKNETATLLRTETIRLDRQ